MGPVAPASAIAWLEWAQELYGEFRADPTSEATPSADELDDVGRYLEQWMARTRAIETFRWQADIDPDRLEFLAHALFNVDARLGAEVERGERLEAPEEGRSFYIVLVRALLHALETESPSRAAFVDQLRWSWPTAAEAG